MSFRGVTLDNLKLVQIYPNRSFKCFVLLPGLPKMPRTYQRRVCARKYKDYTDESLREAVTTMKQKNLTLREASARFGIPKSSSSNALNGKHCVEKLGEIWYLISKKRNCSSPI